MNYQVGICNAADLNFPEKPPANLHGWLMSDEKIEPLWCEGDVLPRKLVDFLDEVDETTTDEEEEYKSDTSNFSDNC